MDLLDVLPQVGKILLMSPHGFIGQVLDHLDLRRQPSITYLVGDVKEKSKLDHFQRVLIPDEVHRVGRRAYGQLQFWPLFAFEVIGHTSDVG